MAREVSFVIYSKRDGWQLGAVQIKLSVANNCVDLLEKAKSIIGEGTIVEKRDKREVTKDMNTGLIPEH